MSLGLVKPMSKNKSKRTKDKVIPFPNLKERLIEKGHAALAEKRYKDALVLLRQAQEFEKGHHEIELGIVICLFELGELEEAKENCWKMLKEDIGDYFHVLQVYLMILVQLGQYEEVETTIDAVLDENSIPVEYLENLTQLHEFSKKMISSKTNPEIEEKVEENLYDQIRYELLSQNNVHSQLKMVQSCKELNIRKYIEIFKEFLVDPDKHVIIKTMIIQLLIANGVSEKIKIEKLGDTVEVIPSELQDPSTVPSASKVLSILEEKLQHHNPTLFETAKDMWLRHLFVIFPLSIEEEDVNCYAGALHYYCYLLHGLEQENHDIESEYEISEQQLMDTVTKIEEIEKISFFE